MKRCFVSLMVIGVTVVGCNKESPKGGPGAKVINSTTTTSNGNTVIKQQETDNRDDLFSVKVPSGETNVTQGKKEEITVTLNRGSNFKQAVKVNFEAPAGLKVIPASVTIKGDETNTKIFVEAMDNAELGRHSITVTGTPETGKATSVQMDIDVKQKG